MRRCWLTFVVLERTDAAAPLLPPAARWPAEAEVAASVRLAELGLFVQQIAFRPGLEQNEER